MYKVIERTAETFSEGSKEHGTFATFQDAHAYAITTICPDVYHEPAPGAPHYWFSDEEPGAYKVHIEKA